MPDPDKTIARFQTDAAALRDAPLPWWAAWGVIWLLLFALAALAWAILGCLDIIVTAPGRLVSLSPTIELRPLERAVIKEIKVRVGDQVRAGQELVTFDPLFNQAEERRLAADLRRCRAWVGRLEAELEGRAYDGRGAGEETDGEERRQQNLFERRARLHGEKMRAFSEGVSRLAQYAADKERQLERYREMEALYRTKPNAISLREINELRIARIQVEADIRSLERERLALEAERNAFVEEWEAQLLEELVRARQELTHASQDYEKARRLVDYVSLYAPQDAVVHMIAPVSAGSAVREAEPILTLAPLDEGIEAQVEIPAQYIGRVRLGQKARLKLSAFPFQQYGALDGIVRYLSRDAFASQEKEGAPGGAWYMGRIALDPHEESQEGIFTIPGMEVQAEIIVGRRRIIDYLLHPLIRAFDEALKEP